MTLGYLDLLELIKDEQITRPSSKDILPQPASLDVPLTAEIYRMPASILPKKGQKVRELASRALYQVPGNQPLEPGNYYLIRADLDLNLKNINGTANNKSSSGRINLQTRLVLDGIDMFDTIPTGYKGEVWVEVHPQLAPVLHPEILNQIRFREGIDILKGSELINAHKKTPFLYIEDKPCDLILNQNSDAILVGVDMLNTGWKGKLSRDTVINMSSKNNDSSLFFERINQKNSLILRKDEFYILGSYQKVCNPPEYCITMTPFGAEHGEFRSHFAGFFDPGNGVGTNGFTVTMEVIPIEDAIEISHKQTMFSIQVERLKTPCPESALYGTNSHYLNDSGPRLAKFFQACR